MILLTMLLMIFCSKAILRQEHTECLAVVLHRLQELLLLLQTLLRLLHLRDHRPIFTHYVLVILLYRMIHLLIE